MTGLLSTGLKMTQDKKAKKGEQQALLQQVILSKSDAQQYLLNGEMSVALQDTLRQIREMSLDLSLGGAQDLASEISAATDWELCAAIVAEFPS